MPRGGRQLTVYVHPNVDGNHSYAVAAYTQKAACALIGTSLGDYKRMGGRVATDQDGIYLRAIEEPGVVWRKVIYYGPPPAPDWVVYWRPKPTAPTSSPLSPAAGSDARSP